MEGIVNFGPNVSSFLWTPGTKRWYIVGAYVSSHDAPAVRRIEQALEAALKVIEVILLGDLNVRLRKPQDNREEELATALEGSGLTGVTAHFTPRQRYLGTENWTWHMRREGMAVSGRGKYILGSDRDEFTKAGVR